MKKYIVLPILFITLFSFYNYSQHTITPGIGYKGIHLKMKVDELTKKLGEPASINSRKQEQEAWENFGYKANKYLVFNLKFDSVYIFDEENDYALWKVFVKKNKVVYLKLTSYSYDSLVTKNINVVDSIYFYDNLSKIVNTLGNNFYKMVDENNNTEYIYFEKGISFIVNDSQLRVINVFRPIKAKRKMIKKLTLDTQDKTK